MPAHRIAAWLALGLLLVPLSGARADRPVYVVQRGDALARIARRFDVSLAELREWNRLEGDRIRIGQRLVVGEEGNVAEEAPVEVRPRRADGPRHTVRRGETLSHIARRWRVTIPAIVEENPGLRADRIRVGQEIGMPESRARIEHRVRHGDRIVDIAERYRVTAREVRLWNRSASGPLTAGATLVIFSDAPASRSESIGEPNRGSLRRPTRLPRHPGIVIRTPARAYGTEETIRWMLDGFDAVLDTHGESPRVRVHDISDRDGGRLRGHRSHQSGRDADVSYYQRRCPEGVCRFARIGPRQLDVARQWTLFRTWIRAGVVEAIFMDRELQEALYQHARSRGATRQQLRRWFQHPRAADHPGGLIRHWPHHRDHFHVRFVCPETDHECRGR